VQFVPNVLQAINRKMLKNSTSLYDKS